MRLAMRNHYVLVVFHCVGIFLVSATLRAESVADPKSLFRWITPDTPLILGRVEDARHVEKNGTAANLQGIGIHYSVRVLADFRAKIAAGAVISVNGRYGVEGTSQPNIPVMDPGTVFLIYAEPTGRPGEFEYNLFRAMPLPIGLRYLSIIPKNETADLQSAFIRLSALVREHGGEISPDNAISLLREKNCYLWAIGVSAVASKGNRDAEESIEELYRDPWLTARQALWLDETLTRFPERIAPIDRDRLGLLRAFLKRSAAGPVTPDVDIP